MFNITKILRVLLLFWVLGFLIGGCSVNVCVVGNGVGKWIFFGNVKVRLECDNVECGGWFFGGRVLV